MENNSCQHIEDSTLLEKFNKREQHAFSLVYSKIFKEINFFSERLFFQMGIDTQDLVQDIFVSLWMSTDIKFNSIAHIKNYLYLSIKNRYRNHLKHTVKKHIFNYNYLKNIDDSQDNILIESETLSILSAADKFLPQECARIITLFLEGYDAKEISEELGKSVFTIYTQRNRAVKTLQKHLSKKNLYFFLHFFPLL